MANFFNGVGPQIQEVRRADARGNPNAIGLPNISSRGAVSATPITDMQVGDGIPEFISRIVEPYIKRKQGEMFVKGMTDQMRVGAETEMLDDNGTFVDKIWGPTAYRQGASFFRAQDIVNKKELELQSRIDDLAKLPDADLHRAVADSLDSMRTGDELTDGIIGKAMIEKLGPLLNTVAKTRIEQNLFAAAQAHSDAISSAAQTYQNTAVRQTGLSNITEEETQATAQSQNNFFGLLAKPPGMTDQAYRKSLKTSSLLMLQQGSFYAFEALKKGGGPGNGLFDILSPEDAQDLEDKYGHYAKQGLETAAGNHLPEFAKLTLEAKTGSSPAQVAAMYQEFNARLRRETGINQDYFTQEQVQGGITSLITGLVSRAETNDSRAYARETQLQSVKLTDQLNQQKALRDLNVVSTAFATGNINTIQMKSGIPQERFDQFAQGLRSRGPEGLSMLVNAYDVEGYYNSTTAQVMQSPIRASVTTGYTKGAERAYNEFKTVFQQSPAAAQQYYGDYFLPMVEYDQMLSSGSVDAASAWKVAFEDPTRAKASLSVPQKKAAEGAVDTFVNKLPSTGGMFSAKLNDSSKRRVSSYLSDEVGKYMRVGLSEDVATATAYKVATATGRLEQYGQYGWANGPNVKPLTVTLGLQANDVGKLLDSEVKAKARAVGWHNDIKDMTITRSPDGAGSISVILYDGKGEHSAPILLNLAGLRNAQANSIKNDMSISELEKQSRAHNVVGF
jgi:hypothetical protein